jgi:hypothetical protein
MFAFRFLPPLALAAAALAQPALAQSGAANRAAQPILSATDGRWLASACVSRQAGDRSFCYGYVLGIADQLATNGAVCRPATVSGEQLVNTVRSHLAASPNDLQRHASFLIRRVLAASYPCRR